MKTRNLILVLLVITSSLTAQCPIDLSEVKMVDVRLNPYYEIEYDVWIGATGDDGPLYFKEFKMTNVGFYDFTSELGRIIQRANKVDLVNDQSIWPSYADDVESKVVACKVGSGRFSCLWLVNDEWLLMGSANDENFHIVLKYDPEYGKEWNQTGK